jgi:hypothetical protein
MGKTISALTILRKFFRYTNACSKITDTRLF